MYRKPVLGAQDGTPRKGYREADANATSRHQLPTQLPEQWRLQQQLPVRPPKAKNLQNFEL